MFYVALGAPCVPPVFGAHKLWTSRPNPSKLAVPRGWVELPAVLLESKRIILDPHNIKILIQNPI